MTQSPGRDGPLLQLQKVDSSQASTRELSPVFSAPSPALPTLESHPICIPSPYTELGHDFGTLPFYGSSLTGYGGPSIADCPPMRQSLSPTLFWSPPTHHGHVSPLAVHRPQSERSWSEPAEENRYCLTCFLFDLTQSLLNSTLSLLQCIGVYTVNMQAGCRICRVY